MSVTERIEGGWLKAFLGAASYVSQTWASNQRLPLDELPEVISLSSNVAKKIFHNWATIVKGFDGGDRHFKLLELFGKDLIKYGVGGAGLIKFCGLLKTCCDIQQPLYRLFYGVDLLLNPRHGPTHWGIFNITGWVCPVTLVVVSGMQLLVTGDERECLDLDRVLTTFRLDRLGATKENFKRTSKVAGMSGALIAMSFSFQSATFNFVTKYRLAQTLGSQAKAVNKLGADGWNQAIAGTKYFCDAAKIFVDLYADNKGIWYLKYAAAGLAVTQTWQQTYNRG